MEEGGEVRVRRRHWSQSVTVFIDAIAVGINLAGIMSNQADILKCQIKAD